jgi:hypothetical protein
MLEAGQAAVTAEVDMAYSNSPAGVASDDGLPF